MNAINAEQFQGLLERDPNTLVIDVRFEHEREEVGYLLNSRHIPWYTEEWDVNPNFIASLRKVASSQMAIVIVCRTGQRSGEACALLESHGYHRVYNLEAGFNGLTGDQKPRQAAHLARWLALPELYTEQCGC